eukprot:TRINITY_DN1765_c0_g1_i2.p1 TRINITY_DN1765_c0_g1~~TRINITY_DN1765_c0_g1_i2.p1  ORF type:complete len:345 (-),score=34.25 TRINITY_DN1765_c0_g1_i2:393-1427(-)
MFGSSTTSKHNPNNDIEVCVHPQDGVSSLSFSPTADILVATCWDNQALCYEINRQNGQSFAKASQKLQQPLLCSAWTADGANVFIGGCDNQITMWNLQTNQTQVVAKHDQPVKHCFFLPDKNMLVTGSWDKTLRYWDLRSPNPAYVHQCKERVYGMHIRNQLLVVGLAERIIQVFNLGQPQQVYQEVESPLKYQTRCVACFPDQDGYLIGSIEGRIAVQYLQETSDKKNFTFKCHREGSDVYAVSAMDFHPVQGTFCTAGSDGSYSFWDKESRQRLKVMVKADQPISAAAFNKDGSLYCYAVSYDWSKGYQHYDPNTNKNYVLIHKVADTDVQRKQKSVTSNRR